MPKGQGTSPEKGATQGRLLRRVLVYTHNSIGLGHAVRTMAVIDGLRAARPNLDFLVLSGTSVPQLFLSEEIETIKLPGIRHDLETPGTPHRPRLLRTMERDDILVWRKRIIQESLAAFEPDAVLIEHSMAGLLGEAVPILAEKMRTRKTAREFVLAHMSRGIYRREPMLIVPSEGYEGLPRGYPIARLYDHVYVLEDRALVDVNREFLGGDPELDGRIQYLGRISSRNADELREERPLLDRIGVGDRPFVMIALGRHGPVARLHGILLDTLIRSNWMGDREILVVLDPYLDRKAREEISSRVDSSRIRTLPFLPHLVTIMAAADLVICRAGYNTVNEILLTGVRALVIPEQHPSGEQERRVESIPRNNVTVWLEDDVLNRDAGAVMEELISRESTVIPCHFDRFRIGRKIAEDLERSGRQVSSH